MVVTEGFCFGFFFLYFAFLTRTLNGEAFNLQNAVQIRRTSETIHTASLLSK